MTITFWQRFRSRWPVTKQDLKELETKLMSAISDFADKQNAFNERLDKAIAGVTSDIKVLNDLITKLQTAPGPISTEDQATLDTLEIKGAALATKLEALDALQGPDVPA